MPERDPDPLIEDMLAAIRKIERYTVDMDHDRSAFCASPRHRASTGATESAGPPGPHCLPAARKHREVPPHVPCGRE